MPQTSREIVRRALRFESPERLPRQLWALPWAEQHQPAALAELRRRWPSDFGGCAQVYRPSPRVSGQPHEIGRYVDAWGCVFTNIQAGVIGEVREPLLENLSDWRERLRPPYETLPENPAAARDAVNRAYAQTELFVGAGCCPRPWERYQFLRGTENAMIDVAEAEDDFRAALQAIHEFHLKELEFWVATDVDSIHFMDDWGAQNQLLISPAAWREFFKPLYRDYIDLAHAHGKFAFMHSDGHIAAIYPDLVELGLDALNSQLFCMDLAELGRIAKGRMTFWGEIDRQHVLTAADPQVGRDAVRLVARHLYDPRGGLIAQFEIGPGAHGPTAVAIMEEWDAVEREASLVGA